MIAADFIKGAMYRPRRSMKKNVFAFATAGVILNVPGVRPTVILTQAALLPATVASSQISEEGKFRMEGVPGGPQIRAHC